VPQRVHSPAARGSVHRKWANTSRRLSRLRQILQVSGTLPLNFHNESAYLAATIS
jgi:hypothetical protein